MRSKAYVLIEAEAGHAASVISALRELPGVSAADPVTGPYDIIVVIETDDQRLIGRLVIEQVHQIIGVKRTMTCLAI
ncbi:MAG: Lrp/AsnC ligand binding domain-containing protein [Roseiflexaceae bacterium]